MNRNKGFSLLSLVVALGLLTITGAFAVQLQLREAKSRIAATWIDAQAREIDQIAAAVRVWTNSPANVASWSADTRTPIPCTNLTNAGLLPAAFGRDGVSCKSPFGTIYTIVGIRNASDTTIPVGRVRSVIYASGSHHPTLLKRAGIPNQPADLQGLAMRTAHHLAERKVPAGWLSAGNTTATGVGHAWAKALSAWINPAPAQASVVALVGFPDLDGSIGITTPANSSRCTGGEIVRGFCSGNPLCLNNGQGWVAPACPPGKTKVGEFPHCKTNEVFQYNSGLGSSLILGNVTFDQGQGRSDTECATYARQFGPVGSEEYTNAREACKADRTQRYETTIYVDGPQPNNFCGLTLPGFAPNPVYPGQTVLAMSSQTWGFPSGRDIVCAICS